MIFNENFTIFNENFNKNTKKLYKNYKICTSTIFYFLSMYRNIIINLKIKYINLHPLTLDSWLCHYTHIYIHHNYFCYCLILFKTKFSDRLNYSFIKPSKNQL